MPQFAPQTTTKGCLPNLSYIWPSFSTCTPIPVVSSGVPGTPARAVLEVRCTRRVGHPRDLVKTTRNIYLITLNTPPRVFRECRHLHHSYHIASPCGRNWRYPHGVVHDALRVLVIKIKCPGLDSQEPHESAGTGWARPSLVVSTPLRSVLRSAALRSTFPAGASALKVPQGACHHPLPYRKHSLDPLNTAPGRMIPNAAPCQLKLSVCTF
jgi:hypothetical protein